MLNVDYHEVYAEYLNRIYAEYLYRIYAEYMYRIYAEYLYRIYAEYIYRICAEYLYKLHAEYLCRIFMTFPIHCFKNEQYVAGQRYKNKSKEIKFDKYSNTDLGVIHILANEILLR